MSQGGKPAALPDHFDVHFQKSNFFRAVHVDGCFGGVTPRGHIHMGVYSERNALPKLSIIPLKDGVPQPEQIVETKQGLVREIEVDLILDIQTAAALAIWLDDKINHLRRELQISDDQWAQMVPKKP